VARDSRKPTGGDPSAAMQRRLREAAFLLLAPVAVYLLLCLVTYSTDDPGWNHAAAHAQQVHNLGGAIGAWIADIAFSLFGFLAYAFPLLLFTVGLALFRVPGEDQKSSLEPTLRLIGGVAFFIGGTGLAHLQLSAVGMPPGIGAGGVLGEIVGGQLQRGFGHLGASLFLLAIFLVALTLATGISWFRVMDAIGRGALVVFGWLGASTRKAADIRVARAARSAREETRKIETVRQSRREPIKIEPTLAPIEKSKRAEAEQQIPLFSGIADSDLPPLSLLDEPQQQVKGYSEETLEALSRQVELKLKDFRIDAHVVGVFPGPVITRFELEPAPGVKGSQISSLDKDIARGLSVKSVRVVDVIPG
jgi:S-DNA-T family DNA segregation ATPase FtsK/SpoIIIE